METKRLPLATVLATRDSSVDKDGILTNCYKEQTPIGEIIVKRPGYEVRDSFGVGCGQGGIAYDGQAIWVIADTVKASGAGVPSLSAFTTATTPTKPTNGTSANGSGGYLVSHSGNLYSIGGRDSADTTISVYRSIDNGTSWSTISTPWTTTQISSVNSAVSLGGFIYAAGLVTIRGVYRSADGITWTLRTADLAGSGSHSVEGLVEHNGLLYALLVRNGSNNPQVWSSSDGGASWAAQNANISALGPRGNMGFVSFDGKLYIIGGSISNTTIFDDVYVSSDGGVNWVLLSDPAPFGNRAGMATWVLDGRMWLGGGFTAQPFASPVNDVWSTNDGSVWLQAAASSSWTARFNPSFTVHNSRLYIGPGETSSVIVAGLYYATPSTTTSLPLTPAPGVSCLPFQLTLIPATATTPVAVFLKNDLTAYYYNGLTVVQITDSDYPVETVYGVVYLDGTIYVMTPKGIIYGSDLAAPTSWSALNFISANAEADAAVALVRQLNYVVAFKQYSTEFFYNAGNATGSPLSKVLNALIEIGCASSGSIAFSDNTVYFMANSRQKGRSIMKMEGYTPKYISNQYVDRILNGDSLDEVYAFVIKTNGHFFYVLTLIDSEITLVFDEVTGDWHRWSGMTELSPASVSTAVVQSSGDILVTMAAPHGQSDGDVVIISGATPSAANGQFNLRYDETSMTTSQFSYTPATSVSGSITGTITAVFFNESYFPGAYYARTVDSDLLLDKSTGDVYTFEPDLYEDNGNPINVKIRTQLNDFGVMATKRYSRLELVGDKESTNVLTRFSDDDYDSWSLYRTISMSQKRAMLRALGSGRRRAFEFRQTENTALRLLAAEMDIDLGAF